MIATLALLALAFGHADACGGITFFGEDINPGTGNDVLPLPATPLADGARDDFFAAIVTPATEDLEAFSQGENDVSLVFPGTTITAELTGGVVREDPPINGQYAISPVTYYSTREDFTVTFSEPIAAFGFYGVDIGDVEGVLVFTVVAEDDSECSYTIPHEKDGPSGNVLYFGFIDLGMPFVRVLFTNSEGLNDRFAFDDFTIAQPDNINSLAPSGAPTQFELCQEGITNSDESICCDAGCGVCGGCDCDLNPGGAALCCPGVIAASGFECMLASDVACILGDYIPSEMSECL